MVGRLFSAQCFIFASRMAIVSALGIVLEAPAENMWSHTSPPNLAKVTMHERYIMKES
jgi:hypothetical protein